MCNTSTLIKSKKLGQILQEIQHAICNLHKVLSPKITCSMITVPEFKGHLRPISYSLFCVPTFFCIKGVCITSCPPQSFRQIFLLEKLKWNQMKHLLFSLKGRLQFSFWYQRVLQYLHNARCGFHRNIFLHQYLQALQLFPFGHLTQSIKIFLEQGNK